MDLMKIDYKSSVEVSSLLDIKKTEFLEQLEECKEFYSESIPGDCSIFGIYLNTEPASNAKKIYSNLLSVVQKQDLFDFDSISDEMDAFVLISSAQSTGDFFFTIFDDVSVYQKEMNVDKKSFWRIDPVPLMLKIRSTFGIEKALLENGVARGVIGTVAKSCFGENVCSDSSVLEINGDVYMLSQGNEGLKLGEKLISKKQKAVDFLVLRGELHLPNFETGAESTLISLDLSCVVYIKRGEILKYHILYTLN